MLSFFDLLKFYGIDPSKTKLVRHSNRELNVLETFRKDLKRFEAYQSFQTPKKFSNAEHIAVFGPERNTLARFLGIWDIQGYLKNSELTSKEYSLIAKYDFPIRWKKNTAFYKLSYNSVMEDLSTRLIIEWGRSTVSWVQSKDKVIVELESKELVKGFTSYDKVLITFDELKRIVSNEQSNITWVNALSNVYGIYLIRDRSTGKLYVGSAYGERGIFGRWSQYARSGHGGNRELKNLDPTNFEFSILELIPSTLSSDEVIVRETQWKVKLGTRENGLNIN